MRAPVMTREMDGDGLTGDPWIDIRAFGAVGDGVKDNTAAFTEAQAAFGIGGGTLLIPDGDFVINDFIPDSDIRFLGIGLRASRLRGTTGAIIHVGPGTTTHCQFENLAFVTIDGQNCVETADEGYAGHFLFRNCNFEAPSEYCIYGNFVLCEFDRCIYGYWPAGGPKIRGAVYLKANAAGTLASNQNLFVHCKFNFCEGPAITIVAHGYNNKFDTCEFDNLDDKIADITAGDSTIFTNCWAENCNKINNAENCIIKFGTGNASMNVIDGFRLTGGQEFTDKFFYIVGASPKIRYQNCRTGYDNFTIITLTGDNNFYYYGNRNSGANVTVEGSGIYSYYKDGEEDGGTLSCLGLKGVAISGTWIYTFVTGGFLPSLTRTNAAATEEFIIDVPLSLVDDIGRGVKPTAVTMVYSVANGVAGDDVRISLRTRAIPADGSAPTNSSSIGMTYEDPHATADLRADIAGTKPNNTLRKTINAPVWLNTQNTTLAILITCVDAGAMDVIIKDVILEFTKMAK